MNKRSIVIITVLISIASVMILWGISTKKVEDKFLGQSNEINKEENNETNKEEDEEENSRGNSIQNALTTLGQVAYTDEDLYFANEKDEGKLYKKNLKTGQMTKLSDDKVKYINIYKDYVYYQINRSELYLDDYHIRRVKTNGSEHEVLDNIKLSSASSIQIIGDYLYYANLVDSRSSQYDLNRINLNDMSVEEVSKLTLRYAHQWVIDINEDKTLSLYAISENRTFTYIEDLDKPELYDTGITALSIFGIKDEIVYFLDSTREINPARPDVISSDDYRCIVNTYDKKNKEHKILFKYYRGSLTGILGNDIFASGKQYFEKVDSQTGEIQELKGIPSVRNSLFEVNGFLTYYDEDGELIIREDVNIFEELYNSLLDDNSDSEANSQENVQSNIEMPSDNEIINLLNDGRLIQNSIFNELAVTVDFNDVKEFNGSTYYKYNGDTRIINELNGKAPLYYSEEIMKNISNVFIKDDNGKTYAIAGSLPKISNTISVAEKKIENDIVKVKINYTLINSNQVLDTDVELIYENNKLRIKHYGLLRICH